MIRKSLFTMLAIVLFAIVAAGCGQNGDSTGKAADNSTDNGGDKPLTHVKVVLDWTPNTNHTGLYVARDKGYYKEQGLDVEIIQPGEGVTADQMVAANNADFGISFQEGVTQARIQGVPVVSIAAIIQHNTSGFAAPTGKNIKSPKDFEGKTYGSFGSPVEEAMIKSLMETENADASKVNFVNAGAADFFAATKKDIDFEWIFYGWTGIQAELRKEPIDMIYLTKYSDKLDYYTPLIITSEKMIAEKKDLVKAFMAATAKGYQFAIDQPKEAADVLLAAVPDLDKDLVVASQQWLSAKYKDDAPRWGEQKVERWQNYAQWMLDHKLLEKPLEAEKAFTNEFLPQ